jgi:hypothetical protein
MRFSFAATVVLAVFSALLTVQGLVPAAAHPFGPPPVAEVTVDGDEVTVRWSAADDDLFALGRVSGAMDSAQVFVYEDGAPVADPNGGSSTPWLATTAVANYLGSHIAVRHAGGSCSLKGAATDVIKTQGVQLRYSCGSEVDVVQVRITALTELDQAYRTVSMTPGGQRALHTSDNPTRTLDLRPSVDPVVGTAALAPNAVLAVLLLSGAIGVAVFCRRPRGATVGQV